MPTASILQYLRRVVGPVSPDALLLARYIRQRDETAFTEIVQRHGPMVWGVCSRALPRSHDAEDAFQATFLVLARKAASIGRPSLLANWLFGVARRTSLEAQKRRARQREEPTMDIAAPDPVSTELKDVLDEEIARLPDRLRVPIVLCYLEGRTNAEAAELLACPPGTIASRLSAARDRLQIRITRRGLAPALGGLTVALFQSRVQAIPPVAATASATALAQGVLTAMFLAKAISVVLAVSCVALLGIAGIAWVQVSAQPTPGGPAPQALAQADAKPKAVSNEAKATKKTYLDVNDELTEKDPADSKFGGGFYKVYPIDLEAGKLYRIDLTSAKIDSYLRLLGPDGKSVASDFSHNFFDPNARIVHKATRSGRYKIVATAVPNRSRQDITGPFHLTVRDPEPLDIAHEKLHVVSQGWPKTSVAEQTAAIRDIVELLSKQKAISMRDSELARELNYLLDRLPKADGIRFAGQLKDLCARSESKQVREDGEFDGVIRRLELPGSEIDITGTTLDGKAFDWKSYRGKVVAIDFFVSNYAPEMRELKKLREKYGAERFDIVAISNDYQDDAPATFMKKNGYEWECIHEKGAKQPQPMNERYGVYSYDTTILVDREGRVLAINPDRSRRDELIERHVTKKSP